MTIRSRFAAIVMVGTAGLVGCSYGFAGGGLPSGIHTVAVQPFENLTSDPTIAQQVNRSVRDAAEQRLGLQVVAESQADVVVSGVVRLYEPDQPVGYRSTDRSGQPGRDVQVSKRLLRVTVELQMINTRTGKDLLRKQVFPVDAQYDPGREAEGRRLALEILVNDLVKEAQSQW